MSLLHIITPITLVASTKCLKPSVLIQSSTEEQRARHPHQRLIVTMHALPAKRTGSPSSPVQHSTSVQTSTSTSSHRMVNTRCPPVIPGDRLSCVRFAPCPMRYARHIYHLRPMTYLPCFITSFTLTKALSCVTTSFTVCETVLQVFAPSQAHGVCSQWI